MTVSMAQPQQLIDEITDFLAAGVSPEEILAFKPSETLQQRASELLERQRQGILTSEESAEIDEFMRIEHFISRLKVKAHLHQKQNT